MTGEPWYPLPPDDPTRAADCDVCGGSAWLATGHGRKTIYTCNTCKSTYTHDGALLTVGTPEGTP